MYGGEQIDLEESSSSNYINDPGVYEGVLKEIKKYETKSGSPAIVFVFEGFPVTIIADGSTKKIESGSTGEISIFEMPQSDPDKAKKQMERIGVIMKRFISEQIVKGMAGVTDWETYRDFIINQLKGKFEKIPVVFKVTADVWDSSNPGVSIPKYKGAVTLKSKVTSSFGLSSKELTEVNTLASLRAQKAQQTTSSPGTVAQQATEGSESEEDSIY